MHRADDKECEGSNFPGTPGVPEVGLTAGDMAHFLGTGQPGCVSS